MNEKAPKTSRGMSPRAIAAASAIALTASAALLVFENSQSHNTDTQDGFVRTIEGWSQCMSTLVELVSAPRTYDITVQVHTVGKGVVKSVEVDFWNNVASPIAVPEPKTPMADPMSAWKVEHTFGADGEYIAQGRATMDDGSVITCPPATISVGGLAVTPGGTPPPAPTNLPY